MAFHGCGKAAAAGHYRRYATLMREAGRGEKIPSRVTGRTSGALKGRMTRSVRWELRSAHAAATWLVQPTTTQPFAMACSSEGTLDYKLNEPSTLQLAKVSSPRSCPGTPIANDQIEFIVER